MKKQETKEELTKVKEKGSKFINEFKTFILKGNVMDLAVGVIIGASFQGLVTSLTNNIISPILGSFSEVDFSSYTLTIGNLHLTYGAFITDVINFIIMAFVVFMLVKFMNALESIGKKKIEPVKEEKKKPEDILLLEEIRDLLKKQK